MNEIMTITDGFTLNPGDLSWDTLATLGKLKYFDRTSPEEMVNNCHDASIIVTNKTPVTEATMNGCPDLRLIAVTATGFNIIDIEAARRKKITVCNVPGYGTDSVAQHAFALILELTNRVGTNSQSVRAGEWSSSKDFCYTKGPLTELAGKTLGIVGYGDIGKKVGEIGRAFGMNIIYSRSNSSSDKNAVPVADLFSQSDVVTLHCPLTRDNAGFVNQSLLRTMKKSALLINTARGQLIREDDLAAALRQGILHGAGLDVLSSEPPSRENSLIDAPNCIITPHNAWYSNEARARIMDSTYRNIKAFLDGRPQNVVNS